MGSFSIKKGELEKVVNSLIFQEKVIDNAIEKKMNLVVDVVYKTAHARRPKVGITKDNRGTYRVSDPDATLGVPVDTGALQASITKQVYWKGKKIIGEISAGKGLTYAKMIEFGTSRMRARPFMRPAFNENLEWIKNKWKEVIIKI